MTPEQQQIALIILAVVVVLTVAAVLAVLVIRKRKKSKSCACAPGCDQPLPFTTLRNVRPTSNSYAVDCDEVQAYVDMRAEQAKQSHRLAVARQMRALADRQLVEEDAEAEVTE